MYGINRMEKGSFLFQQLLWGIVAMVWYNNLLFRCAGNLTLFQSRLLLWALFAAGCVLGILREFRSSRNAFSIFCNLATGLGIYTAMAYSDVHPAAAPVLLAVAGAASLLCMLQIWGQPIQSGKPNRRARLFRRRLGRSAAAAHSLLSLALSAEMILILVPTLFGAAILSASAEPTMAVQDGEQTIAGNMQTLLLLQTDRWEELSLQQRLDVLQTAANIEQSYLGLPNELNVASDDMETSTSGYYEDATHQIVVSLRDLKSAAPVDLLDTICHEACHSYQHRLAELYESVGEESRALRLFRNTQRYVDEFQDYQTGSEDFDAYYSQACETDARVYAETRVDLYCEQISEYLSGNSEPAEE